MKSKRTLLWFVVVLIGLAALLLFRSARQSGPVAVPAAPTANTAPREPLIIQDGQTIDFSSGQPVISSSTDGADFQADLEAMKAASEGLIFSGEDLPPAPEEPPPTGGNTPPSP